MEKPHYDVTGWHDGAVEVDPPEPGKEWLTVRENDEEYAVIVLRTDASIFQGDPEALESARMIREQRASHIAKVLNANPDPWDALQV
jgi:hypothetical protein